MRLEFATFVVVTLTAVVSFADGDSPEGKAIVNPYFKHVQWRVWRDDDSPVENLRTLVRDGKKYKSVEMTLKPTPVADRMYPTGPLREGQPIKWETRKQPPEKFAGM